MALFKYGGKRAFLIPQKGLLCSVGRSLAPDSGLKDQLCWTIDFTVIAQEQQNEQYSCHRAQPDDFFFVGSTSINSSYSAVHLCSWATPCTVLAQLFVQLSNGRDQRTGPPRSFPRCFSQIKFPNILVDTMQEEQKSMGNHRSWSLAEGQ